MLKFRQRTKNLQAFRSNNDWKQRGYPSTHEMRRGITIKNRLFRLFS